MINLILLKPYRLLAAGATMTVNKPVADLLIRRGIAEESNATPKQASTGMFARLTGKNRAKK